MQHENTEKTLKIFLSIIAILVLGFIGLSLYAIASDYKPDDKELIARPDNPLVLKDSLIFSLLTWNIGYAGLDKDMDFFKDGGTKVITPEDNCRENISAIADFLMNNDTVDFILLQEIDKNSKRSYRIDQYQRLSEKLSDHDSFFTKNYDVFFAASG